MLRVELPNIQPIVCVHGHKPATTTPGMHAAGLGCWPTVKTNNTTTGGERAQHVQSREVQQQQQCCRVWAADAVVTGHQTAQAAATHSSSHAVGHSPLCCMRPLLPIQVRSEVTSRLTNELSQHPGYVESTSNPPSKPCPAPRSSRTERIASSLRRLPQPPALCLLLRSNSHSRALGAHVVGGAVVCTWPLAALTNIDRTRLCDILSAALLAQLATVFGVEGAGAQRLPLQQCCLPGALRGLVNTQQNV